MSKGQSTHFSEFDEQVLQRTLEDFYTDSNTEKKTSLWNLTSISGLAILFVSFVFIFQMMLGAVGINLSLVTASFMESIAVIGGGAVIVTGLGWFRRKKGKKKLSRAQRKALKASTQSYNQQSSSRFTEINFSESKSSKRQQKDSYSAQSSSRSEYKPYQNQDSDNFATESYGLAKNNRLFRSRKDKVLSGVLSGIAKYTGINTALLRLIFVIGFFMSGGFPLFIGYILASFIIPKEPRRDFFRLDD